MGEHAIIIHVILVQNLLDVFPDFLLGLCLSFLFFPLLFVNEIVELESLEVVDSNDLVWRGLQ